MINLGDSVQDGVTGFKGIVVAKTQWLNGCERLSVQPECLKPDGSIQAPYIFDESSLIILKKNKVKPGSADSGGPIPTPKQGQPRYE